MGTRPSSAYKSSFFLSGGPSKAVCLSVAIDEGKEDLGTVELELGPRLDPAVHAQDTFPAVDVCSCRSRGLLLGRRLGPETDYLTQAVVTIQIGGLGVCPSLLADNPSGGSFLPLSESSRGQSLGARAAGG